MSEGGSSESCLEGECCGLVIDGAGGDGRGRSRMTARPWLAGWMDTTVGAGTRQEVLTLPSVTLTCFTDAQHGMLCRRGAEAAKAEEALLQSGLELQ